MRFAVEIKTELFTQTQRHRSISLDKSLVAPHAIALGYTKTMKPIFSEIRVNGDFGIGQVPILKVHGSRLW